jgi:hypothetical protein
LVLNRYNIRGGVSTIYSSNSSNDKLRRVLLTPVQGIVHDDNYLWHHVTPICIKNVDHHIGFRDIIGIDIVDNINGDHCPF